MVKKKMGVISTTNIILPKESSWLGYCQTIRWSRSFSQAKNYISACGGVIYLKE